MLLTAPLETLPRGSPGKMLSLGPPCRASVHNQQHQSSANICLKTYLVVTIAAVLLFNTALQLPSSEVVFSIYKGYSNR